MFCPKCGAEATSKMQFCVGCGAKLSQSADQPAVKAPAKKRTALWISLAAALLVVIIGASLANAIFFSKPRDLNVKYTDADYKSALDKLGIQLVIDGRSGYSLDEYLETSGDLSFDDYQWTFSEFQRKSITLTKAETTAFLNEFMPNFQCYDELQVNILDSGEVECSARIDADRLAGTLDGQVSLPVSGNINIYTKGELGITNNDLTLEPKTFEFGTVALPKSYIGDENINMVKSYFNTIYTAVPGLEITAFKPNADGTFTLDGMIPQKITAVKNR